jgi:SAM-dependent methyltransferase
VGSESIDRTFRPEFVGPRHRLRESLLLDLLLSGRPGVRVINVGAGQGTLSQLLEQRGFLVASVDPSPKALVLLRELCVGPVVSAEAAELPFPDGSFDAAVLGEVLEHIDDDAAGLRGVARVVRTGGIVVASVPANPRWFGPSDEWAGHKRRYTRHALLDLCATAALNVERLRPWGFPVSSVYHRFVYEPRLARVGPKPADRKLKPAIGALQIALQLDRLFVGVERGALGYLLLARKPDERT